MRPVPRGESPLCATDLRVRAVDEACQREVSLLAGMIGDAAHASTAEHIAAGLEATAMRRQDVWFGPFEGMLQSDGVRAALADRFGPTHVWSAGGLEDYAYCPFRYLLEKVLRIKPLEELQVVEDSMTRGVWLHAALAAGHRAVIVEHGKAAAVSAGREAFLKGFMEQLAALTESLDSSSAFEETLQRLDLKAIEELLDVFWRQHVEYERETGVGLLPAHFEVSFGSVPREGDVVDPISKLEALALGEGEEAILLSGRIDRIDVGKIGERDYFSIVDFKSGKSKYYTAPAAGMMDRYRLQLDLYAWAAELLLSKGAAPLSTGHWFVRDGEGHKAWRELCSVAGGRVVDDGAWSTAKKALVARVRSIVEAVRRGEFPMESANSECTSWCDFKTVCRVNEARSMERGWRASPFAEEPEDQR
jgi:hypothetical protein